MLGWGSEVLSDIPGDPGGPTQYSILNTLPLDLNPKTPKPHNVIQNWIVQSDKSSFFHTHSATY